MKVPIEKPGTPGELVHFGVKGMRWGHRKARTSSGGSSRKERKAEKKFAKATTDAGAHTKLQVKLHNATGDAMNKRIPEINAKYKKAIDAGTLLDENHPTTKKYYKEFEDEYIKQLNIEATKMGASPSGKTYKVVRSTGDFLGFRVMLQDSKVKHADSGTFSVRFITDDKGRVTGFEIVSDELKQSAVRRFRIVK